MVFFFFNDTATTEIYTFSLHDALPIFTYLHLAADKGLTEFLMERKINSIAYETVEAPDGSLPLLTPMSERSEELTSELESRQYLVCRLLLEKKKYSNLDHTEKSTLLPR